MVKVQRLFSTVVFATALCAVPSHASAAPPTLASYVDKDPRVPVRGVSFLRHPKVLAGVNYAVPAGVVRNWVLALEDTAAHPVEDLAGWLNTHICERHNCGHQWSILIEPKSGAVAVCYHDDETTGVSTSWWFFSWAKSEVRAADPLTGACPIGHGG
jgi:hypothetical protein